MPIPAMSVGEGEEEEGEEGEETEEEPGTTEIQLGGLNTTDKRFSAYKGYVGCLSSKKQIFLMTIGP